MEPEKKSFLENLPVESAKGLSLADAVLTLSIVVWSVVGTWRGCFIAFQMFEKPLALLFTGGFGQIVFYYIRHCYQPRKFLFRVIYIYVFMVCIIAHWAAIWTILDQTIGNGLLSNASAVLVCFIMILMKVFRNILAPPFLGNVDSSAGTYFFPTFFRTRKRSVSP